MTTDDMGTPSMFDDQGGIAETGACTDIRCLAYGSDHEGLCNFDARRRDPMRSLHVIIPTQPKAAGRD